jgi:toxin ParE1/3/4
MPRCVLTESALADLQSLVDWYQLQGEAAAGVRLARLLLRRIQQLERFPLSGRKVPEFDQEALRELIEPPYRVVYRVAGSGIQVVRIWRSERLLPEPEQL